MILPVRCGGAFAQCGHTPERAKVSGTAANYPYHARLEVGFSLFVAVSTPRTPRTRSVTGAGPLACACVSNALQPAGLLCVLSRLAALL
jgi:hypothetical protein